MLGLIGTQGCIQILTLQLRTTEIFDNIFPVWWIVESPEIGLQLSTENFQCCTLSDTVRAYETENLSRSWHGQTMELEAVGRIAMCDLGFEVGWQVDDVDCSEWAFLGADTTSYAEGLGDKGDFRLGGDFDTKTATADDRARLLALLSTFLHQELALHYKLFCRAVLTFGLHCMRQVSLALCDLFDFKAG